MAPTRNLAIAAFFSLSAGAQDVSSQDELTQTFLNALPEGTITNPESFESNGFRVQSLQAKKIEENLRPTGKEMDILMVNADSLFQTVIEKGRERTEGGITIFHRQSGAPMFSTSDSDGDGRLDFVTYTVIDEGGGPVLEVTDYEADGQPDLKAHLRDGYFEIWHSNGWHRAETRDGRRGIFIDGDFVELQRKNNRWIVP